LLRLQRQIVQSLGIVVIDSMVLLYLRTLDLQPQLLIMKWIGPTEIGNAPNVVLLHRLRTLVLHPQLQTMGEKESNKSVNVLRDMRDGAWMEMIEEEDNNLDVIWDHHLLPTLGSPLLWKLMEIMYQLK
jgi:hypothetical protein